MDKTAVEGLFAVIPTIGIGGPLAILAVLFPSLFGGGFLLLRQWAAFLAVFSVSSLLFCVRWIFGNSLAGQWWANNTSLWLALMCILVLGTLWAWQRSLANVNVPKTKRPPEKTEHAVLWLLSICCGCATAIFFLWRFDLTLDWKYTFVICIGIWAGTLYQLFALIRTRIIAQKRPIFESQTQHSHAPKHRIEESIEASNSPGITASKPPSTAPTGPPAEYLLVPTIKSRPLPTEGIILCAMMVPSFLFLTLLAAPRRVSDVVTVSSEGTPTARFTDMTDLPVDWHNNYNGLVLSSPAVDGDKLYAAAAHRSGAATMGVVYCLDRHTGNTIWKFDDDGSMKQIYSSPCIADGRLYIGEGFHYDPNCKLYCLDAKTGKKIWDFQTCSQTESTPVVDEGKVYFGAGNDGVYCLDAKTGKMIWRYGQKPGAFPLFRVCATPAVKYGEVYVGSGVDRDQPQNCEFALVKLDAKTGKEIWKVNTNLPCWSTPTVNTKVFFALGNGDLFTDDPVQPGGAVMCLSIKGPASSRGAVSWRYDVPNGVHCKPAVDGRQVYFGCRDGNCYCVGRFDGKLRWKTPTDNPIIASPVLSFRGKYQVRASNVFFLGSGGEVLCLDAGNGKVHWSHAELATSGAHLLSSPVLVTTPNAQGNRRQLYFGASLFNLTIPKVYCFEDLLPKGQVNAP